MLLLDHLGLFFSDVCELYRRIWVEVVVLIPISMWQLVYANRMREYLGLLFIYEMVIVHDSWTMHHIGCTTLECIILVFS